MRRIDNVFLRATSPFVFVAAPLIADYSVISLRGPLLQLWFASLP
jgi:hypothetical protein